VPPEVAEAGTNQRLPADGGGIHQEPGADEAARGKAGGQPLYDIDLPSFWDSCFGYNDCTLKPFVNFLSFSLSGGEVKGGRPAGNPHVCRHSGGNHR